MLPSSNSGLFPLVYDFHPFKAFRGTIESDSFLLFDGEKRQFTHWFIYSINILKHLMRTRHCLGPGDTTLKLSWSWGRNSVTSTGIYQWVGSGLWCEQGRLFQGHLGGAPNVPHFLGGGGDFQEERVPSLRQKETEGVVPDIRGRVC